MYGLSLTIDISMNGLHMKILQCICLFADGFILIEAVPHVIIRILMDVVVLLLTMGQEPRINPRMI